MFFNDKECLSLRIYCQSIVNSPRRLEDQIHTRSGGFLWCEDWEIIEILKCLFNGVPTYEVEPPPNRLKNNPLWNKKAIVSVAKVLVKELKTVENIIELFKATRRKHELSA